MECLFRKNAAQFFVIILDCIVLASGVRLGKREVVKDKLTIHFHIFLVCQGVKRM